MNGSEQYLQQIEQMGDKPDFRRQIVDAYKDPVLKPLAGERSKIESQYLPSMFSSFIGGTEASDMSPAAKLAKMGSSLGRITSRAQNNQDIQNFYDNQIGQLAQGFNQDYSNRMGRLQNLYNMQFQREQAEEARRARQQQLEQNQMNLGAIEDYINKLRGSNNSVEQDLNNLVVNRKPGLLQRLSGGRNPYAAFQPGGMKNVINETREEMGLSPISFAQGPTRPSVGQNLTNSFSNFANTALNLTR